MSRLVAQLFRKTRMPWHCGSVAFCQTMKRRCFGTVCADRSSDPPPLEPGWPTHTHIWRTPIRSRLEPSRQISLRGSWSWKLTLDPAGGRHEVRKIDRSPGANKSTESTQPLGRSTAHCADLSFYGDRSAGMVWAGVGRELRFAQIVVPGRRPGTHARPGSSRLLMGGVLQQECRALRHLEGDPGVESCVMVATGAGIRGSRRRSPSAVPHGRVFEKIPRARAPHPRPASSPATRHWQQNARSVRARSGILSARAGAS